MAGVARADGAAEAARPARHGRRRTGRRRGRGGTARAAWPASHGQTARLARHGRRAMAGVARPAARPASASSGLRRLSEADTPATGTNRPRRAAPCDDQHVRILAVCAVAHPGGAEIGLLRLSRRLLARGHELTLATPEPGPLDDAGLPVVRIALGGLERGGGARAIASFAPVRKLAPASPTSSPPTSSRATSSARSAPAPSCRPSATRPTPRCATPTSRRSPAFSTVAPTPCWSRPPRTCCRPRQP